MKRKIFSILFALVLVVSFSLMTAVPAAAVGESTFNVTSGTHVTTPTDESTGVIVINLTGSWGDPSMIGEYTATGTGGIWATDAPTPEIPGSGTAVTVDGSGTSTLTTFNFSGSVVQTAGDPITSDTFDGITGTIIIQPNGGFTADLTGLGGEGTYTVYIDMIGSMVRDITNVDTPENFFTIQAAIDDADTETGDTITVGAGTYNENIVIDESNLIVKSLDKHAAVIDGGGGTGIAVKITASNVTLSGFIIENAEYGIDFDSSVQGCTVEGNKVQNISDDGIRIFGAGSNKITGNEIANITDLGIYITTGASNIITNNYIHDCYFAIEIWGAKELAKGNKFENNTIENNDLGIVLFGGSESQVIGNLIQDQKIHHGIMLQDTYGNTIKGNTIKANAGQGIRFVDASNNTIVNNSIESNDIGLYLKGSSGNNGIHDNNIIGNTQYGINNEAVVAVVDATNNWWGDVSGPNHGAYEGTEREHYPYGNPGGSGNAVSDNVRYEPWLTREFAMALASNTAYLGWPMVYLDTGWNIVSTPIALDPGETVDEVTYPGADTFTKLEALGDGVNVSTSPVYRFAAELSPQHYVAFGGSEVIQPCEAYYVNMESPDILPILFSPETSAATKDLYAGWNLVGLAWLPMGEEDAYGLAVDQALKSVEKVTGDLTGYAQVVSPPVNQYPWVYTGDPTQIATLPKWETGKNLEGYMLLTNGYWVFMINDGTLAGFTFTPMSLR